MHTAAGGNGGDGGVGVVGVADGSVGGGAAESTSRVLPGWEHFHFAQSLMPRTRNSSSQTEEKNSRAHRAFQEKEVRGRDGGGGGGGWVVLGVLSTVYILFL